MNKFHERIFFASSKKVIWLKKIFNCMHGLKSAILAIFRNWLIGWIGHALLVQPSISAHRK
jgi:hypothetical protein